MHSHMVILSSESDHIWDSSQVLPMDLTVPVRGLRETTEH